MTTTGKYYPYPRVSQRFESIYNLARENNLTTRHTHALLFPCGFNTLECSWAKATIGICALADYSVAKKCQHLVNRKTKVSFTEAWHSLKISGIRT
jgi:hypothetical protein